MRKRGHLDNPETQRRTKELQRLKAMQYDADLQAVMRTSQGRRFVWRIISDTSGFFSVSMHQSSQVYVDAGKRWVGARLMQEVQRVASAEYVQMVQESLTSEAEERLHRNAAVDAQLEGEDGEGDGGVE